MDHYQNVSVVAESWVCRGKAWMPAFAGMTWGAVRHGEPHVLLVEFALPLCHPTREEVGKDGGTRFSALRVIAVRQYLG